jgi:hypothetical protein
MKIIAHRGNVNGRILERENSPDYIMEAIGLGFDVEIDVWYINDEFYLGHDNPVHKIDPSFCLNCSVWCHAKNKDALHQLLKIGAHCFWHENDSYTLTSKSVPWCFPGNWIDGGVTVVFSSPNTTVVPPYVLGVCVDDPVLWSKPIIQM